MVGTLFCGLMVLLEVAVYLYGSPTLGVCGIAVTCASFGFCLGLDAVRHH